MSTKTLKNNNSFVNNLIFKIDSINKKQMDCKEFIVFTLESDTKEYINVVPSNPDELLYTSGYHDEDDDTDINDEKIKKTKKKIETNNANNISQSQIWSLLEKIMPNDIDNFDFDLNDSTEETIYDNKKQNDEINIFEECGGCGAKNTIIEDLSKGYIVCTDCGLIIKELIDNAAEWKQYGGEDAKGESMNRCGAPTNYYLQKSSLGTTISGSSFNRLKMLQNWNAMPYKERSLKLVMDEITANCTKNNISKIIIDDANFMYKKITECKHTKGKNIGKSVIIRGNNRKGLIAACVFFACVLRNTPQSPKEIAKIFNLDVTYITKGCKQFFRLLRENNMIYNFQSSKPADYVPRYCNKLKIHKEYIDVAVRIANNIKKIGIASDHTASSIAAGSILMMATKNKLKITKKNISDIFQISEVTISKISKKLTPYINLLIHDEACEYIAKTIAVK
jgi:transcription initiation factor TFIIB